MLHGLRREAEGDYEGARKLYLALLGLDGPEKGKGKASNSLWKGETDETFIVSRLGLPVGRYDRMLNSNATPLAIDRASTAHHVSPVSTARLGF